MAQVARGARERERERKNLLNFILDIYTPHYKTNEKELIYIKNTKSEKDEKKLLEATKKILGLWIFHE